MSTPAPPPSTPGDELLLQLARTIGVRPPNDVARRAARRRKRRRCHRAVGSTRTLSSPPWPSPPGDVGTRDSGCASMGRGYAHATRSPSIGNVTSSRGNVTSWAGNETSSIGIAPVWIAARGVSLGPRHAPMQTVTRRHESGPHSNRNRRWFDRRRGSLVRDRASLSPNPDSFPRKRRAPARNRAWSESKRDAFEGTPVSFELDAAPLSSRPSPFSIRSGHGCFGPEHSSIRPRWRPKDAAHSPKEKVNVWIEEGALSNRTGRVSIEEGRISIEPCSSSIERDIFSIERGSFSIDGVSFSTGRCRMP